jgi:hypothetical protein
MWKCPSAVGTTADLSRRKAVVRNGTPGKQRLQGTLDLESFNTLFEAQLLLDWRLEYNHYRPHQPSTT